MAKRIQIFLILLLATTAFVSARAADDAKGDAAPQLVLAANQSVQIPTTNALPRLAPELALQFVQKHAQWQNEALTGVTDEVEVDAQLPDTAQKGDFRLIREYASPNALSYTPVAFTGDDFVKHNVITKLLQSEVDHVQKGEGAATALSNQNYKFSYKGSEKLEGRDVHVFQVKPRKKVPGLFKGKIYVDAFTGSLRRAEGTMVKSPSLFIKNIEFVQDYDDVSGFNFPVRMHSTAKTRVVGRAIVNIFHRNYQPRPASDANVSAVAASSSIR